MLYAIALTLAAGTGGDVDWTIPAGQTVVFNTARSVVAGRVVTGGEVSVHELHVEDGAILKIEGPNPFVLRASGAVRIDGTIDISGADHPGVHLLNSRVPFVPGAAGHGGGGSGGAGSPTANTSSPAGSPGFGAFGVGKGGGRGGETGWSYASNFDLRRGAGGAGGRFAADVTDPDPTAAALGAFDQSRIGLDAEPGFDNRLAANGGINGPGHASGGALGTGPFVDGDPANDFFGTAVNAATGALLRGELHRPFAGAGGGAGGDAAKIKSGTTFPPAQFLLGGDEFGAGGGGGAGSLRVLARGPIVFGANGQIAAKGGLGGGGENAIFLNRVGGGSGGGSGGHVILETAAYIDLSASTLLGATTMFGRLGAIDATGGQGGSGASERGGSYDGPFGHQQTQPKLDACPDPQSQVASAPCFGLVNGAGGDGGPGVVQLHAPAGVGRAILLPPGFALADVSVPSPVFADGSFRLLPWTERAR